MSNPASSKSTVLVTGASQGIGLATATLLSKDGWTVFAGALNEEEANTLQAVHSNIRPVLLDVTNQEQIINAIETVRVAVGDAGLDALVNNAGGAHFYPLEFFPPDEFEYDFQLNVIGAFRVTQAAIPLLRAGNMPGRIINISSMSGRSAAFFAPAYSSAKHALEALSSIMRQELRSSGISVSVLGLGAVKTGFLETVNEKFLAGEEKHKDNSVYKQHYKKVMHAAAELIGKMNDTAITPEEAAEVIKGMLETSWLRHRYCENYVTWFMTCIYTYLPYWITERFSALMYKAK